MAAPSIDEKTFQAYLASHEVTSSTALETLKSDWNKISLQSQAPYQTEFAFPEDRSDSPPPSVPPSQAKRDPQNPRPEALLQHTAIQKADFGVGNHVSALVKDLLTRQISAFNIRGVTINSPRDFASICVPLRSPLFESLKVAFLDDQNRVVHSQILSVGTINQTIFYARDFIASLVDAQRIANTSKVIVAHNHPSADPTPSSDDFACTKTVTAILESIGANLVDHVVTNGKKFYSFKAQSTMQLDAPKAPWELVRLEDLPKITPPLFVETVSHLRQVNPDHSHVLYLNSKLALISIERHSRETVEDKKLFLSKIARSASAIGGVHFQVDFAYSLAPTMTRGLVFSLRESLGEMGIHLIDAADYASQSYTQAGFLNEKVASVKDSVSLGENKPSALRQFINAHAPRYAQNCHQEKSLGPEIGD
ncbi:MAG: JAB domain-containing protein [Verrucomicrobiae bacterium]|nr:JAB domain-containing protein [Verrucomicrobiae bacterium]